MNASHSAEASRDKQYDHNDIEKKWQKQWEQDGTYKTKDGSDQPKQYILDMFPYPSGEGLHVGHPRGYIATDVYSRKKRMEGFNVLHPMGWDAFGLPAENYAIKNKVHPSVAVDQNVARFKEQLSLIGVDYDWSREINTTDPKFYKWTQWIFVQMFKKGLAYESNEPVNWCPVDKTVLANEDVEPDGTCERCGAKVEKKAMRQWVLKITDYADRLLADLDKLPKWPEGVKEAQRNWIGRNEGSEIDFPIAGQPEHPIKIFTTRADTLYGVTFIAVSAGLAKKWMDMGWKPSQEIGDYIVATIQEESIRDFKEKEKTGIYAGFDAIHPATKENVPIWITNYVMSDVGTGAIMGVPAHDERDFAFAKKYELPIKSVISKHWVLDEQYAERVDSETVVKIATTAVIRDKDNNFYFTKENNESQRVGLVGGCVEEGEDIIEALKREITEETGFTDFEIGRRIFPELTTWGYRFTKQINQRSSGPSYEVILSSLNRVPSEVEKGDHELLKINKEDALSSITAPQHKYLFEQYLNNTTVFTDLGALVNSNQFNGFTSQEAKQKITEFVGGKMTSTYRIKDWVFSRQRYWGEPIPIVHCDKCGVVAVPEKDLPVLLPDVEQYEPTGTRESPLAAIEAWVNTTCPDCGGTAKRETNTMPQWAGSSWYYLRYIDPINNQALIDPAKEKEWMPVDVYVGGDHATRHLIYARFWHKFLFDIGVVSTEEPFPRLEFLGFILASDGRKMSKRWKNVVNPDDMIATFGADAFRLYEMFIGPFENTVPWSTDGMVGTRRFIEKVWRAKSLIVSENTPDSLKRSLHKTIKKVSEDIETFKFNTAVSTLMILVNDLEKTKTINAAEYKTLLRLLAPFAPHMTEELWYELGDPLAGSGQGASSIHLSSWPVADPAFLVDDTVTIGVQVNGKVRDELTISTSASKEEIEVAALALPRIKEYTEGVSIKQVIVVPGRIINIVTG